MIDKWLRGDFMETYTGRQFHPLDPDPEDIDIVDIAHALSQVCRYGGHSRFHYSVAQHSILVAEKAHPVNALRALLHDATEAFLGDMIRPLKKDSRMWRFVEAEAAVEKAICAKFELPYPIVNAEIKRLDNQILLDERRDVMAPTKNEWRLEEGEPLGVTIERWTPEMARVHFLRRFEEYSRWQKILEDLPTLCADELRGLAARMRDEQMSLFMGA